MVGLTMKQRSRTLRPGFFMNEILADLSYAARLLFAGLWTVADKEGRLEDRPKQIKAYVFPYGKENVDKLLTELYESDFVLRYAVNGTKYIQVNKFSEHQNIHSHEAESVIPDPPLHVDTCIDNSGLVKTDHTCPVGRGRDKGRGEGSSRGKDIKSELYAKILADLNEKAKKEFSPKTDPTCKLIEARLREGKTFEDFQYVHTVKCNEWLGGEHEQYLRPETLYSAKHFESYRNQKPPDNRIGEKGRATMEAGRQWLERNK